MMAGSSRVPGTQRAEGEQRDRHGRKKLGQARLPWAWRETYNNSSRIVVGWERTAGCRIQQRYKTRSPALEIYILVADILRDYATATTAGSGPPATY